MQHFADFGYVKQANKQLKRIYETKIDPVSARNLGELSAKNTHLTRNILIVC